MSKTCSHWPVDPVAVCLTRLHCQPIILLLTFNTRVSFCSFSSLVLLFGTPTTCQSTEICQLDPALGLEEASAATTSRCTTRAAGYQTAAPDKCLLIPISLERITTKDSLTCLSSHTIRCQPLPSLKYR